MYGSLLELQAQGIDLRQQLGFINFEKEAVYVEEANKGRFHAKLDLQITIVTCYFLRIRRFEMFFTSKF